MKAAIRASIIILASVVLLALFGAPASAQDGPVVGGWFVFDGNNLQVLSGSGAPSGAVGSNGDLYVRSDYRIYQKIGGSWVPVTVGSAGSTAGTFVRFDGTGPEWSTLALPNSATQYRIPYATATNTIGESANLTFDGDRLTTTEAEFTSAGAIVGGQFATFEQEAYGADGYKTRWGVGYDGVTWFDSFDENGDGAWMPMGFRALSFSFNAAATFDDDVTVAGDIVAQGNTGSDGFVSQTTGWRVTDEGAADFRSAYLDELKAKIFTADLEQALAGSQTVSKSVAVLYQDFVCPAPTGTGTLHVEDLPGASDMNVFVSGDSIVLRTYARSGGSLTIGDCVGVVSSPSTSPDGYQSWTFTRGAGSNGGGADTDDVIEAGSVALDFGVTGNGVVETTAVDGAYGANSPYVQIKTWTTAPVSGNFSTKVRLGNLEGITGTDNEYGLMAGNGTWTTSGRYFKASNEGVELVNVPLSLYASGTRTFYIDPSGPSWAMGATLPTAYGTGTGCWAGLDAGVYKWRCGIPGGQGIFWNGTTLNVTGDGSSITSIDGGNISTGTVTASQIAADTITASQIAADAITTSELAADSVTSAKIVAATIVAADIAADTITASQIAADAITTSELAADSVTSAKIVAGTIVASDIATDTITASQIAADAITASELAADSVTSAKIVAGTIVASDIATGTITGTNIAGGTITAGNIAAGTITATEIAAGTITADKLTVSSLSAVTATTGALTVTGDLSLTTGSVLADDFTLSNADGLVFDDISDDSASVRWGSGSDAAHINGGSSRLRLRGPGSTWSQINLNPGYIQLWANITSDGDANIEIGNDSIIAVKTMSLGASGYPWDGFWVDTPTVTSSEYPLVVLSSGEVKQKTDGYDGDPGCSGVSNLTIERGIVVGVSCSSPGAASSESARIEALEREVSAILSRLSSNRVEGGR